MVRYTGRCKTITGTVNTNQGGLKLSGSSGSIGARSRYTKNRVTDNVKVCGENYRHGVIWSINTKKNSICVPPASKCQGISGGVGRVNAPRFSCTKTTPKTQLNESMFRDNILDVAIIGSGISGAYISHELRKTNKYNIIIYEKNQNHGGRLLSDWELNSSTPQVINESGGMRIFPSVQHKMVSLLKELNIETQAYPLGDENAFLYIDDTNNKIPLGDLKENYFEKLLIQHALIYPDDDKKNIYDSQLHTMSVKDVWDRYSDSANLDKGVYEFWKKSLGYDSIEFMSAALWKKEMYLLSNEVVNHHLVKNGWQNVVSELINDTPIKYGKELIRIQKYNDYNILIFNDGDHVIAKHVFITIPIAPLLSIRGLNTNDIIDTNYNLLNYPGTKTFLKFKHAWWKRDFGIKGGRTITSRNSRMIFYWDSDTILIYTAGNGGGDILADIYKKNGINGVIEILIDDLSISHYGEKNAVPLPIQATFKSWDMIATFWKPNADVINLKKKISLPCGNRNVYYSNSNISLEQGWMEGAVNTADGVLKLSNLL